MEEVVKLVLYSGPSVLVILAGLVWGKKLIEYFFDEAIEIRKLQLNQNLEGFKGQIEQQNKDFQHQLDRTLNEFNIRFSKLHEERAEVIKELYKRIVELHSAMVIFTRRVHVVIDNGDKEEEERLISVNKALNEFHNFFIPNRIFFNKVLAGKLENLSKEYWNKGWDFASMHGQFKAGGLTKEIVKSYLEKSRKITETIETDFVKLIEDLENEFRQMLGVK